MKRCKPRSYNIASVNRMTTQLITDFLPLELGRALPVFHGNSELLLNYITIFIIRSDISDTNMDVKWLVSNLEGRNFEARTADPLSLMKLFVVFLRPSRQILEQYRKLQAANTSFHIIPK